MSCELNCSRISVYGNRARGTDTHRHKPGLRSAGLSGLHAPRQAEVAHFQVAIRIEQQIRGFEVTMDDICAVQSLECAEGLVHEILLVGVFRF